MRCDAETHHGMTCDTIAHWEAEARTPSGVFTVYCCDTHRARLPAQWVRYQWRRLGEDDSVRQARFEHYRDECDAERNYTQVT